MLICCSGQVSLRRQNTECCGTTTFDSETHQCCRDTVRTRVKRQIDETMFRSFQKLSVAICSTRSSCFPSCPTWTRAIQTPGSTKLDIAPIPQSPTQLANQGFVYFVNMKFCALILPLSIITTSSHDPNQAGRAVDNFAISASARRPFHFFRALVRASREKWNSERRQQAKLSNNAHNQKTRRTT